MRLAKSKPREFLHHDPGFPAFFFCQPHHPRGFFKFTAKAFAISAAGILSFGSPHQIRLRQRHVPHRLRDLHHLLLINAYAQRVAKNWLKRSVRVSRFLFPGEPFHE